MPRLKNPREEGLRLLRATKRVKSRYNAMAGFFNFMERFMERSRIEGWRKLQWSKVEGTAILEVGVGTGANFAFYPPAVRVTAIDISPGMLRHAREKAARLKLQVDLREMDVQALVFPDNSFDTVVASLVFCAVPDPSRGLSEIRRVCKPGGKIVLLEHVLSSGRVRSWFMNLFNPATLWMAGENVNRRTVEAVASSGLAIEKVSHLSSIFKLIEARKQ